ncbi:MAG: hypothetical protein NT090_18055 [Acidobacteria bacterium]|nr:hypothetical protein [Acidobacteriota bacterium]
MYLLICEAGAMDAVRADLTAEVQVQLGFDIRFLTASEVRPEKLEDAFLEDAVRPVVLITLDRWLPKLIDSLDRNVVVLTRAGTVLLLADRQIAERALAAAPNLRSRIADVLAITPDEAFGGARS